MNPSLRTLEEGVANPGVTEKGLDGFASRRAMTVKEEHVFSSITPDTFPPDHRTRRYVLIG